jgi:hypothetical protein
MSTVLIYRDAIDQHIKWKWVVIILSASEKDDIEEKLGRELF